MQQLFAALVAFLFVAGAQATGTEDVFDRYVQALEHGNLQALLDFHSEDVVFAPPGGGPVVKGKQGIEAYYKGLFANTKSRRVVKTPHEWHVSGGMAVRSSNGIFETETASGRNSFPLRNTYVWHRENESWKLIAIHISTRAVQAAASLPGASAAR